jgi:hypothetical protein
MSRSLDCMFEERLCMFEERLCMFEERLDGLKKLCFCFECFLFVFDFFIKAPHFLHPSSSHCPTPSCMQPVQDKHTPPN